MSHSRKLSRNVAQFLAKSLPDGDKPKPMKKGTPFKNRRHAETFERNGKFYVRFMRVTKGFHVERIPTPGARAGVIA